MVKNEYPDIPIIYFANYADVDMIRKMTSSVNIDMISSSEIKISCIIADKDLDKAVTALHETFIED